MANAIYMAILQHLLFQQILIELLEISNLMVHTLAISYADVMLIFKVDIEVLTFFCPTLANQV